VRNTHWFVIGAGGGIGRAICRLMAREGATIVAADVNLNNVQATVAELTGRIHPNVNDQNYRIWF